MFHRGHEHSGRLAHLVDELDLPDCDFFAWDARGAAYEKKNTFCRVSFTTRSASEIVIGQ